MESRNRPYVYLQELFERTAEGCPDSVAVHDHDDRWTYKDLEALSNRVGQALLRAGCGPNARVCILTGKNIHAYCGVLAALKAGGCWVPLNEEYPEDRLRQLLESVEPVAVVVESRTLEIALRLRDLIKSNWTVFLLDGRSDAPGVIDVAALGGYTTDQPVVSQRSPEDLAYIIFTSGSTGTPKGVMVYHRNIVQFLGLCFDFFSVQEGSRFAHHSELTFDPSLLDLFFCWATRGTLVPFNRRRYRIDPCLFVRENRINVWFSVPSAIATMQKSGQIGSPELACIKHLILTGESATAELINQWKEAYPECAVYNVYGTTETAIISHWCRLEGVLAPERAIPVGTPLPGIHIFLLEGGVEVAQGEIGECYVYGSQISPGYWRNDAENRTRYLPHPFDPTLPQKIYRTGDLLRIRCDGHYEYIGRADRQVKIRGHRVELREVETAILPYPGIQETAVVAVKDPSRPDEAHTVAFIVSDGATRLDQLQQYLRSRLPGYMVPSRVRIINAIPKNANQKVDYLQLKVLAESNNLSGDE